MTACLRGLVLILGPVTLIALGAFAHVATFITLITSHDGVPRSGTQINLCVQLRLGVDPGNPIYLCVRRRKAANAAVPGLLRASIESAGHHNVPMIQPFRGFDNRPF
ncbi:hypothetical protein D3C76_1534350 [compost metagenome]